ncbi:alcohol dehydrogenase catalytic domain-containing protein [Metallosphaera hakonensis]|uniref:Alcohol dehydrogenase n=1 Tax=Metallosphaera hakonensis JCM 8857 = DSM 7519 TaxID=1293036 RepID=A0A2U9IRR3_9CREN|nr:alcohol dehydrogenase catalytic domain-containing protein [Metallosphaera hakonensis]AWR98678.1 alcohol dehydrogenase catalytic domain-containing protein [Metallosphaera hakonensis JCM 8857 = DSM 7519]
MKALVFEKNGLDNLKVSEIPTPELGPHDVLVRVKLAGVNPIDYFVVQFIQAKPMPHIPGAEVYGEVEKVGEHVKSFTKGDKVVVYNRVFDGSCDMCLSGREMLCRNGGIMSVVTQGGFAEYMAVPEKNLVKVDLPPELSASLPVSALTSYHALKEVEVKPLDYVVVFGASGNTGMFAVQLAKKMGARVIAVSSKGWVKEMADHLVTYDTAQEKIKEITKGRMADVVINSVGQSIWDLSLKTLGVGGRLVFFGGLTGSQANIDISSLYSLHQKLVGTTGGTRKELTELTELCADCKVKVWKTFSLEEGREALEAVSKGKDGRIFIRP